MIDSEKRYEVVRCPSPTCEHESVRPREGRRVLPCVRCGSDMILVPLIAEPRPSSAQAFGIHAMREALGAAAARTLALTDDASTPLARALNAGRREAYQDAMRMAEHMIETQAAPPTDRALSPALQHVVDDLIAEVHS